MFEETLVCMHCGRPVDSQVYCSKECESLDASSPSVSASSSTYPSPYLQSSMNAPGNLADIPPLVPSVLGGSRTYRTHRAQQSVSSSSNSSTSWSAFSDEDDDASYPQVVVEGENAYTDPSFGEGSLKSPSHAASSLLYARRPSTTNHRSTIPLLHRRASSISSPLAGPVRSPMGASASAEDDLSDVPPISLSSSASSKHSRKATVRPMHHNGREDSTISNKRHSRNLSSLPAYFSLLQLSPSSPASSTTSSTSPPSRQAGSSLSQSLRTSPTTPRMAHPLLSLTHVHAESSHQASAVEAAPRGRLRRKDPEARSASGRRSLGRSPPRQARVVQDPTTIGSQARARLDSMEKVFEWVSNPPASRGRTVTRRNSSPHAIPSKPQLVVDENGVDELRRREGLRGRRKPDELPAEYNPDAPGYGNGRSGLRARERLRGRAADPR